MTNERDDIAAVEAAADFLVQSLNRTDISSVTDFITDGTVMMPARRRTAQGKGALAMMRNLAESCEGFRLMPSRTDVLAPGVVRDLGTFSMRRRREGDRVAFRYLMVWVKGGPGWTLSSMTWNHDVQSAGAGAGRDGAGGAGGRQQQPAADDGLGDM